MNGVRERVLLVCIQSNYLPYSRLSRNVTREVGMYLTPLLLVCVSDHCLRYFDFKTETMGRGVEINPHLDTVNAVWIVVDVNRVFVCGGGDSCKMYLDNVTKTALFLDMQGSIHPLPSMLFRHNKPGVLSHQGSIYVFGSYAGPHQTSCEQFHSHRHWNPLPEMHRQRALFTPVPWKRAIYLCGGHSNSTVESFDGVRMIVLELSLPENGPVLTCLSGDELVLITRNYRVGIMDKGKLEMRSTSHSEVFCGVYSNPVLFRGRIYNANGDTVAIYSASTGHRFQ